MGFADIKSLFLLSVHSQLFTVPNRYSPRDKQERIHSWLVYKSYPSDCFDRLELLVMLTQCLNYNICDKFKCLIWKNIKGMRNTYLHFCLSARERLKLYTLFGIHSDQRSNNAKPHQFFHLRHWEDTSFLERRGCIRGESMTWTKRMQNFLHPLPYSFQEGILD